MTSVAPYMSLDLYGLTTMDGAPAAPAVGERRPWVADEELLNLVAGRLRLEQGIYGPAVRLFEQLDLIGDVLAEELGRTRSAGGD